MKKLFLSLLLAVSVGMPVMAQGPWQRGAHDFEYTGYEPLAEKKITVRYFIPLQGDIQSMRVLFVIPGAQRDSRTALESWKAFAEKDGFIVIAPEYTTENGWLSNDYQQGGIFTDRTHKKLNPPEKWTYNTIEALFDYFKEETGNTSEKYDIHGHSAGGQFVHRMVIAMPKARIRLAVASNPSSWTYPFIDGLKDKEGNVYGWPYSVKGTPFANEEDVKRYLAAPLIVHLGNADISTTVDDLDKSACAQAQGAFRFERGNGFIEASKQLAEELNTPCNWQRVEVDQSGHSGRFMIYGKSKKNKKYKDIFSTDNISTTGAYSLIFGK